MTEHGRGAYLTRAAGVAAAATVLAFPASAGAAFPGANGRLAFECNLAPPEGPPRPPSVCTSHPDGSDVKVLAEIGDTPAWSPDGQRIAFDGGFRENPARRQLHVMNADGSGGRAVGEPDGGGDPSWSPDGRHVVVTSAYLRIVDVDGGGSRDLPRPAGVEGRYSNPEWSPDGELIAYVYSEMDCRNPDVGPYLRMRARITPYCYVTKSEVRVVRSDGTGGDRLLAEGGGRIDWSPDGSRITFERYSEAERETALWVVGRSGAGVSRLPIDGSDAAWSPAGDRIVFWGRTPRSSGYDWHLQTAAPDGSSRARVSARGSGAGWQPLIPRRSKPVAEPETQPPARLRITIRGATKRDRRLAARINRHLKPRVKFASYRAIRVVDVRWGRLTLRTTLRKTASGKHTARRFCGVLRKSRLLAGGPHGVTGKGGAHLARCRIRA